MATFSSGMVQYRTTTAYTPSPTERYVVWQGVTRFSGSDIVVTCSFGVSETALAARALATGLSLGFARQPDRLRRGCALSRGLCSSAYELFINNSLVTGSHSAAWTQKWLSTGFVFSMQIVRFRA